MFKTTKEWARELRIAGLGCEVKNPELSVLEPIGWENKSREKKITRREFVKRLNLCEVINHYEKKNV